MKMEKDSEARHDALSLQVKIFSSQVETLTSQVEALNSQIGEVKKDLSAATERVQSLE